MSCAEITFDDVALYFSAEEWEILEKWQKELYRDVMVDHYQTLLSVGLMKVIPEIILKIMMGEEPAVNHKSAASVPASETPAPQTPAPEMSPARPQGTTSLKQTLGNSQNNTSGTTMNLRHKKLNLPLEIFPRSTRQKEKVIHKRSEVQENILENHNDPDVDQLPAIDKQTQGGKHYICVDCGKTFGLWSSLVSHTTTNSCVRTHSCSDCGASYSNQSQLLIHQKTHSGSKPHECPTCRKHFLHKSSLEVHIRSHTGERPFICNLCNKRFKELGNLRRHERIHTGERPFRCDTCGKCFNDSSVMTRHQKVYCPSRKGKLEKSHLETVNPSDLDGNCEVRSDPSNTCVEGGQVCVSLLTPRAKVTESGQGDLRFSGDAKVPTMKELNNTSSTIQEITSNHMKPIDASGKQDNEYHPTTVHGENTHWTVETPVPNTHMKGIVDKCENYLILVLPPTQKSNTHPNSGTMSENTGKDTDNRVNSQCEAHQNTTNGSVEMKKEKDISLYSVCGPHKGPTATNPNMVAQISEVNDQQYSLRVKQECEDKLLGNTKFESQSSAPPSGVKCEIDEQAVTQQINSFIQEELKTVEDTSGFPQNANQESPQVIGATQIYDALSQNSKAKNQERSSNQKVGMKTRSQEPGADEKPSQCAESGKRLNDPSSLNTHNQKAEIKTSQEPGVDNKQGNCNQCGENFTYNCHSLIPHRCHTKKKNRCDSDCGFQHGLQLDQRQKTHSGHTCQECGRTFRYKDILILHLRTHTEDGRPYPCKECGKAFKEARGLQRHLEIHMEKPSEHAVSGERFNDPSSLNNQKVETKMRNQEPGADEQGTCNQRGESYTYNSQSLIPQRCQTKKKNLCDCGKSFQHSFQLKLHQKTHRSHTCHDCGRTFRYKAILNLHLRTHGEDMRPYPCTKCGKAFMEARSLQRHLEIHTREKPSEHAESGEGFNDPSSLNSLNNEKTQPKTRSQELGDDNKQRTCNQCGESYMYNGLRLIPHRCHTEKNIFQCDCGKSFQDASQLKQHQKTYSDHKCQKCGRAFRSAANLILHLPTHMEDRPYSCTECGKAFKEATKLRRHLRNHTGEKPFQCGDSGLTFDDRSSLNRHSNQTVETKTRDQDPGDENKQRTCNRCGEKFTFNCRRLILHRCATNKKIFQCDCGQGFQHGFQLELHQKTHSDHKCQPCGKVFKNKANLLLHLRTHAKDRPYPCVECGKAFKEASKLRRHLRIHTGEKPFECSECGRMFNDPSSMNRHRRIHIVKAH